MRTLIKGVILPLSRADPLECCRLRETNVLSFAEIKNNPTQHLDNKKLSLEGAISHMVHALDLIVVHNHSFAS